MIAVHAGPVALHDPCFCHGKDTGAEANDLRSRGCRALQIGEQARVIGLIALVEQPADNDYVIEATWIAEALPMRHGGAAT